MERYRLIPKKVLAIPAGIIGAALVTALGGCTPRPESGCYEYRDKAIEDQRNILTKAGILGKLPLIDLRTVSGFSAQGGGFISFRIDAKSQTNVQFAWRMDDEDNHLAVISEVPLSRAIFKLSEIADTEPTVSFDIDPDTYTRRFQFGILGMLGCWHARDFRFQNPNDYLPASRLTTFTMSEKEFSTFRVPG